MTPALYRYRDSESVIRPMEGYTPPEGWAPLYSQAQVDEAVDAALERAAQTVESHAYYCGGLSLDLLKQNAAAIRALKEE